MIKTKFSILLHIMTLLATYKDEWLNSTLIAESLNINPVLVRKELAVLKSNGLIESKEGKNGGVHLLKDAETIQLSEIFEIAKGSNHVLSSLKNVPNPNCRIGKQINKNLENVLNEIDQAILDKLSQQNLEKFKDQF